MAAKNILKYKRNQLRPLIDVIDLAIESCLSVLRSPDYKGTITDLIRMIRLSLSLAPPTPPRSLDRLVPT